MHTFKEKISQTSVTRSTAKLASAAALASTLLLLLAPSAFARLPSLDIYGNALRADGQSVSIHGVALPPTDDAMRFGATHANNAQDIYNLAAMDWLRKDWGIQIIGARVSAEGSNGFLNNPDANYSRVDTLVAEAIDKDIYVLISWDSAQGPAHETQARVFFERMAKQWGDNANIIYEVNYQPGAGLSWSNTIKPFAQNLINAIRAIDPDNLIIVGTPNHSRDVLSAAQDPISQHHNIAYAMNFIVGQPSSNSEHAPGDFPDNEQLCSNASQALAAGITLMATGYQIGNTFGSGSTEAEQLAQWRFWLKSNRVSSLINLIHSEPGSADASLYTNDLGSNVIRSLSWDRSEASNAVRDNVRKLNNISCVFTPPAHIQAEAYCQKQGLRSFNTRDIGGGLEMGPDALELFHQQGSALSTQLAYQIDVPITGNYTISYRMASIGNDGSGVLDVRNVFLPGSWEGFALASVPIPATNGFDSWQTVTHTIPLKAGKQWLNLRAREDFVWGLNWLDIKFASFDPNNTNNLTVQAENFINMQGIQTEATSDIGGGENIGYLDQGDWIRYAVSLPASPDGQYDISYRVSSPSDTAVIQLEAYGGNTVYDTIKLPNTGGWQNWQVVTHTVTLPQGLQDIVLSAPSGAWNLNWFDIAPKANCIAIECPSISESASIRIEAEDFSFMNGIIVSDESANNAVVGWVDDADWLVYSQDLPLVSESNRYKVTYRVARGMAGDGVIQLEAPGGQTVYSRIKVTDTGGWDNYITLSHTVEIPTDAQGIALFAPKGGWNLDWFEIETVE